MFIARFSHKQWSAVLVLLLVTALSSDLLAQTKPKRSDVGGEPASAFLWVGNSFFYYNNSMHNHVGNLARAADPKGRFRGTSVTIGNTYSAGLDPKLASFLQTTAWETVQEYYGK